MADTQAFLELGRQVLGQQPFSVLLGAELIALEPGCCELGVLVAGALEQHSAQPHEATTKGVR